MKHLRVLWKRVAGLFGRDQRDADLAGEIEFHVELQTQDNLRAGMSAAEARRQALIKLGGMDQTKESYRDRRGLPWLDSLLQDIRFALRMLRKNPGFTTIAVLTLALGIGANTAIFSLINSVVLQRYPFPSPDRIVVLHRGTGSSLPYAEFQDIQSQNHSFELLALERREDMNLTGVGAAERTVVRMVSPDFFAIFGIKPLLGHLYTSDEDHLGAPGVVVMSELLWRMKFSSNPGILGKSVTLGGKEYAVIGVVPNLPRIFGHTDFFYPIGQWSQPAFRVRGEGFGTTGLARLKPGESLTQARTDLNRLATVLAATYPKEDSELSLSAVSFREDEQGTLDSTLLLLFGAVGLVLLIACGNVANLLLARSIGRTREMAIRIAVGAGRSRIIRQLLTEASFLGVFGGIAGVLLAKPSIHILVAVAPRLTQGIEPKLDLHVLAFTIVLSLLTGLLFGLVPALKADGLSVQETLKSGGHGATSGHQRVQGALVVSEIALAVVLLAGAGLLVRSLSRAWRVNPGFDPSNIFTFNVAISSSTAEKAPAIRQIYGRLIDRLIAIPGADSAAVVTANLPFTGDSDVAFWREDQPRPERLSDAPGALWYSTSPDYLRVMRIPLLHGRFFTREDTERAPDVVVVNDAIARRFFPNEDPIGKHIHLTFFDQSADIVGVVGTVKQFGLDARVDYKSEFELYIPFRQIPDNLMPLLAKHASVVLRSVVSPASLTSAARHEVKALDDQQVMFGENTMAGLLKGSLFFRRSSTILLEVFAALALVLATVGIYGVISNLVGQRTREIGVRIALGARPRDILRTVVGRALILVTLGIALGIGAMLPMASLLSNMLFGVTAADPATLIAVAILVASAALGACSIPARRAMRVDPMVALRHE